jgi:outer membrane protein TolC
LQQTILSALAEVENAGAGVVRTQERVGALETSLEAADRSVELSQDLYRAGLVDFFQVLEAEKSRVAAEEDLLVARQNALAEVVRLYRSLGGGWQVMDSVESETRDRTSRRVGDLR